MKLPRIYTHFNQGQVFTIEEASRKLGTTGNTLRKRLSDLSMRGYLSPIRQGLYRLARLDEPRFCKFSNSPLEIAAKLTKNCYLGYKTALEFHANENISENQSIYIISKTKFNSFMFDTREYIWCQSAESYGVEVHSLNTKDYSFTLRVTNLEKTLLDCLKRPAYCNNFQKLLSLCDKLHTPPNFNKILNYSEQMNIRSVFNRIGYLLELKKTDWAVPDAVLNRLEEHMSAKQIDWNISSHITSKNRWKINFLQSNYKSNPQKEI